MLKFRKKTPKLTPMVVPKSGTFEPDTEIRSINIGGLSFLTIDRPNFQIAHEQRLRFVAAFEVEPKKVSDVGGIPLYIKSGVDIKDITVTVRPRMRIRCRVLLAPESLQRIGIALLEKADDHPAKPLEDK